MAAYKDFYIINGTRMRLNGRSYNLVKNALIGHAIPFVLVLAQGYRIALKSKNKLFYIGDLQFLLIVKLYLWICHKTCLLEMLE